MVFIYRIVHQDTAGPRLVLFHLGSRYRLSPSSSLVRHGLIFLVQSTGSVLLFQLSLFINFSHHVELHTSIARQRNFLIQLGLESFRGAVAPLHEVGIGSIIFNVFLEVFAGFPTLESFIVWLYEFERVLPPLFLDEE